MTLCYKSIFFILLITTSCIGSYNEFMNGAPLQVVETGDIELLKPVKISKEYPNMLQLLSTSPGELVIGFSEGERLLSLYDAYHDSFVDDLVYSGDGEDSSFYVGMATLRFQNGKMMVDTFVRPHSIISLDMDRVRNKTRPYIVERRLYDDYFPWSKYQTRSAHVLNDNIIAIQDFKTQMEVRVDDKLGNIVNSWTIFPHPGMKKGDWSLSFYTNPNRTRAVLLMEYFDKLHFLDLIDNCHFSVTTNPHCPSDKKILKSNAGKKWSEQPSYYRNGCVTNEYVYALYVPVKHCSDALNDSIQPQVQVFDWKGSLMKTYLLEESVYAIAVDENNNFIYGLTWDDHIITYRM